MLCVVASGVFSPEMDAAASSDNVRYRIFEKRLRIHDFRSILVEGGDFFRRFFLGPKISGNFHLKTDFFIDFPLKKYIFQIFFRIEKIKKSIFSNTSRARSALPALASRQCGHTRCTDTPRGRREVHTRLQLADIPTAPTSDFRVRLTQAPRARSAVWNFTIRVSIENPKSQDLRLGTTFPG